MTESLIWLDIRRTSQFIQCSNTLSVPYFSLFLQNLRMQQPLAHLYFLTLLEHLQAKKKKLSGLVSLAKMISVQCESHATKEVEAVVLWVELQAVVQVIIHGLATCLNPSRPHTRAFKANDINRYLME